MTPKPLNSSDLQAFINAHAIPAEIVYLAVPTPTVETAAEAVDTHPRNIVKSILFLVEGQPVLALANGTSRIEYRVLAAYFDVNRKKVKLANAEQTLAITGYEVGAVPPFGHPQPLRTLMDTLILETPQVYAGGGERNALLRVAAADIQRIAQAEVLDLRIVSQPETGE